ncbi:DUF2025 family protein [Ectopseudomonas hydrolytica]|jgi:hypothetical protein|uniref:DUF2025 family protein n=1 Tax=Ectopseudomonas hydrolytica TaxID=2493633 RepID=A0ABY5A3S9_9GAMM|nr:MULTISPECIES: DUF2025 family protein [Pseudomonas]EJO93166.1 hypothetical protein A471_16245 [Pseudomonas mendocina DLHK]MDH0099692.1 DUF2025 family protein [Pseudomonas sp. GD04158]USR38527.1 DUF2025 family protein [Pseudomonas hydrolytica]
MSISSAQICQAADQLQGFVGFNAKTGQHLLRFSEDSFGLDVPAETITPTCEYVWAVDDGALMRLDRQRLAWLQEQRIDDRVNLSEPLRVYLRRSDLPEIRAERRRLTPA